jgi:ATP-dependent Lhr-like helicase
MLTQHFRRLGCRRNSPLGPWLCAPAFRTGSPFRVTTTLYNERCRISTLCPFILLGLAPTAQIGRMGAMHESLKLFQPAIAEWFRETFAEPTPAQAVGWPRIAAAENVLIHAPTGSGKTLAAFLYAINELASDESLPWGVHTLYLSPLKALAADVERNLETPLAGIRACARRRGEPFPDIRVGVRTGDTPPNVRQRMVRHPPNLLITTPESLHLLLTSPRAREMLRSVRYVLVDEIHTVCAEKRGSFLALLLERLEALAGRSPIRVGLSATQRPLEEVARFLGGYDDGGRARPVVIVDAGERKDLDLEVVCPVDDLKRLPYEEGETVSVWPSIFERLLDWTQTHRSTLIFANSRRVVERIAAEMNRLVGYRMVRAHHGSVSKEYRHEIEEELKAGRLPALVATSSLELGIDIGAIDLVCQVEAPSSVAGGLQRVGRAGHVFRATSKGRMLPKTRADLLRMAATSQAMLRGEISAVRIPRNPLDVLAQQIVAMVAVGSWDADGLYRRVRQAHPFRQLPRESYDSVLEMVSGRYRSPLFPGLRGRVLWERATGALRPVQGARQVAALNGGTIPDTAQIPMVLEDGRTRLGELDEEFVFERRVGEAFVLGTGRWRITEIRHDRVLVTPSDGAEAQIPFWKGEGLGHDAEFGLRFGRFVRECEGRLRDGGLEDWLREEAHLDRASIASLAEYLSDQRAVGPLPDDATLLVDAFTNPNGEERVAVLSTFGRSFHLALWLALCGSMHRGGRETPQCVFSNDGILMRPGAEGGDGLVVQLRSLRADELFECIASELAHSPYFALRFRRNAARALLLPRSLPGRRIPLWLQRLRSHDLLQYASQHPAFPIVAETYREILEDALPMDALIRFVEQVEAGSARIAVRKGRAPSPFAASLLLDFEARYLYEQDLPARRGSPLDRDAVGELLQRDSSERGEDLVSEQAIRVVEERLQSLSPGDRVRDGAELVDLLVRVGDLNEEELAQRCEDRALEALPGLLRDGRVVRTEAGRLVAAEDQPRYATPTAEDRVALLVRYISAHAGRTTEEMLERYPGFDASVGELAEREEIVRVDLPGRPRAWLLRDALLGLRRLTLSQRRSGLRAVAPQALGLEVLRRQGLLSEPASADVEEILLQLAGCRLPMNLWSEVLEARGARGEKAEIDALIRSGRVEWRGGRVGAARVVAFAPTGSGGGLLPPASEDPLDEASDRVIEYLGRHGASFAHQVVAGTGLEAATVDGALWNLIWRGKVTNDSLDAVRLPRTARRRRPLGRWSLPSEEMDDRETQIERALRVLLARYGLLCREVIERAGLSFRWSEAYSFLTRMEWRGEVERGFFVTGLSGVQFADRAARDGLASPVDPGRPLLLHVSDPANLFGDVLPVSLPDGGRWIVRHHPGNYLVVRDGIPVLAVEGRGARLTCLAECAGADRLEALGCLRELVRRPHQPASIRVETWNGRPVTESPVAADLESLGFLREDRRMILYRSYGAVG